ncbi:MAG TPA: anti-sigma factor [Thermoanaerobaculia bacterium]|nr:anti-sigma factor [Thermoanaerobaculia bacterium]
MNNGDLQTEDLTILAALEALDRWSDSPGGGARPDEISESDTLARLYTEVLGLMPFELEPVAPSPEARARLLSLVQGDETQPASEPSRAAQPASAPAPAVTAVPSRPSQEMRAPRPVQGTAVRRSSNRWPLALAATLAFLMLGLSAWLYLQLGEQRQRVATLQQQLATERARADQAVAEARQIQASQLDLQEKFTLVTSPAVSVSPMRPAGESPLQPGARGILFVASNHQHWYLTVNGLQPAEKGQAYKLWFLADQGAVSGGSFTAKPGTPMDLSSKHMPAGTKGVLVTLEEDPQTPVPTGPEILKAAATYEIS